MFSNYIPRSCEERRPSGNKCAVGAGEEATVKINVNAGSFAMVMAIGLEGALWDGRHEAGTASVLCPAVYVSRAHQCAWLPEDTL